MKCFVNIKQQNKKSESNLNPNDDWLMVVFCICGIIAFFIAFAILENPIGFAPILIGLLGVVFIILWISEKILDNLPQSPYNIIVNAIFYGP